MPLLSAVGDLFRAGLAGLANLISYLPGETAATLAGQITERLGPAYSVTERAAQALLDRTRQGQEAADVYLEGGVPTRGQIPSVLSRGEGAEDSILPDAYRVVVQAEATLAEDTQYLTLLLDFPSIPTLSDIVSEAGQAIQSGAFSTEGSRQFLEFAAIQQRAGHPEQVIFTPTLVLRRT